MTAASPSEKAFARLHVPSKAPAPRPGYEEAPSDPKEELRRAKAAYADARRAAGKSNAPKIVAACPGAALLVGAGAGAT